MTRVILVNEDDEQTGVMEKIEAHQKGVLHRAFSVMIINDNRQVLLQKRAAEKYHSPGLWTNACCSHQQPDINTEQLISERLHFEMGIKCPLTYKDKFVYLIKFENGLTEHELDYVYEGNFNGSPIPNKEEVAAWRWVNLHELKKEIKVVPENFTYWFRLIMERYY